MKSLQGHFLVAAPRLSDSNFYRTVVLMVQHDDEGAMGLVLNRPLDHTIGDVWQRVTNEPCECDQPLYLGGPVAGPLIAVHNVRDCSESEVMPGVYLATQRATLERLFQSGGRFRLFSGYSGWSGGQLEDELQAGGWLTVAAEVEQVFTADDDELWRQVSGKIGEGILRGSLRLRHVPDDPRVN